MLRGDATVFADDLTGAAECGGAIWSAGLAVSLLPAGREAPRVRGGTWVIDTDTRLCSANRAAETLLNRFRAVGAPRNRLFKKVDSLLRGSVVAECVALAVAARKKRILLVPGNPAHGRTVASGVYRVHGVPLDRTPFALDPHHPARSARVIDLLGPAPADWPFAIVRFGDVLPRRGLIVGETSDEDDLPRWSLVADDATLPAGSAAFLRACLSPRTIATQRFDDEAAANGTLLVSGTALPAAYHELLCRCRRLGWPVLTVESDTGTDIGALAARALAGLREAGGSAVVAPSKLMASGAKILLALAEIAAAVMAAGQVRRLLVEGGATAAAIVARAGFGRLDVVCEVAPGVVTLRPESRPMVRLTLKPGSYPWPDGTLL